MRIEDTPGLFGSRIGVSTSSPIFCEWCDREYNSHVDLDGDDEGGESIGHTKFAGLTVCDCCWDEIERGVLRLMTDILPWYTRILARRKKDLKAAEEQVREVEEALKRDG